MLYLTKIKPFYYILTAFLVVASLAACENKDPSVIDPDSKEGHAIMQTFNDFFDQVSTADGTLKLTHSTDSIVVFARHNTVFTIRAEHPGGKLIEMSTHYKKYASEFKQMKITIMGRSPELAHGHYLSWVGGVREDGSIWWAYQI